MTCSNVVCASYISYNMKLLWQETFMDFAVFCTAVKVSWLIISITSIANYGQLQMFYDKIIYHRIVKVSSHKSFMLYGMHYICMY